MIHCAGAKKLKNRLLLGAQTCKEWKRQKLLHRVRATQSATKQEAVK